jgi:hypothetical protein
MHRNAQVSTVVSSATRLLLEKHVRATGVKKGYLIEEALLHHLRALEALPRDIIVPPRLVVSRRSGDEITKRVTAPAKPTKELRTLLRGNGD